MLQPLDLRLERVFLDVGEYDVHAFGGEALDHCQADSACASGYDRRLACKLTHDSVLLLV